MGNDCHTKYLLKTSAFKATCECEHPKDAHNEGVFGCSMMDGSLLCYCGEFKPAAGPKPNGDSK